jgi:hypothetical protein
MEVMILSYLGPAVSSTAQHNALYHTLEQLKAGTAQGRRGQTKTVQHSRARQCTGTLCPT